MSGKICNTESTGRQRTEYTNSPNNFVTRKKKKKTFTNIELTRRTDNREDWTAMIADVCNRRGT